MRILATFSIVTGASNYPADGDVALLFIKAIPKAISETAKTPMPR